MPIMESTDTTIHSEMTVNPTANEVTRTQLMSTVLKNCTTATTHINKAFDIHVKMEKMQDDNEIKVQKIALRGK